MQKCVDNLKFNVNFDEELTIDIILDSLHPCYDQFRMTYHMNKEEVTLSKLQGLLRIVESSSKGKFVASTPTATAPVLAIGQGKGKKRKAPSKNHNGKSHDGSFFSGTKGGSAAPSSNPKDVECFHCHDKGNWKRSYQKYMQYIKDGKIKPSFVGIYTIQSNNSSHAISWVLDTGCGFHIYSNL